MRSWKFGCLSLAALVCGVLLLAACSAGIGKGGAFVGAGPAAESLARHGDEIKAEGDATGNPLQTIIGGVLSLVGAVGTSVFATKRMVAKQDAKPFEGANGQTATEADLVAAANAAKAKPPTG